MPAHRRVAETADLLPKFLRIVFTEIQSPEGDEWWHDLDGEALRHHDQRDLVRRPTRALSRLGNAMANRVEVVTKNVSVHRSGVLNSCPCERQAPNRSRSGMADRLF